MSRRSTNGFRGIECVAGRVGVSRQVEDGVRGCGRSVCGQGRCGGDVERQEGEQRSLRTRRVFASAGL